MEHDQSIICMFMLITMCVWKAEGQLQNDFYQSSCPNVERIVSQAVLKKFIQTEVTAQATLRLFFHDCFIQGCDASIMIYSPNNDGEKDHLDNVRLAGDGFDTVMKAKQAVEDVCPGVVSCADILALATRDAIVLRGGPSFTVELGRRDGLRSKASDVPGSLPMPDFNLDQLISIFAKNNLSQTDMIALSGAHTIGVAECDQFAKRLYNFSQSSPVDPTLNPTYALQLMAACYQGVDPRTAVPIDPLTQDKFDNLYYQDLVAGKGTFTSDEVLFTNPASQPTVVHFANNPGDFYAAFISGMKKLGRVGVKTGNQGEIRRNCAAFNS